MSGRANQWGGLATGDAEPSTHGKTRTDPPDKREARTGNNSAVTRDKSRPLSNYEPTCEPRASPTPRQPISNLDRKKEKQSVSLDNLLHSTSGSPFWIDSSPASKLLDTSQLCSHPCKHQQGRELRLSDHLTSDPQFTRTQDGGTGSPPMRDELSHGSSSGNDVTLTTICDIPEKEVVRYRKDYPTKVEGSDPALSSSPSVSPRFTRCRRQSRVNSSDDPNSGTITAQDNITLSGRDSISNPTESCYKFYLDGKSIDGSPDKNSANKNRRSLEPEEAEISNVDSSSKRSSGTIGVDRHSSLDQGSNLSLTNSDDRRSEANDSGHKKKKKKSKRKDNEKSTLSIGTSGRGSSSQRHDDNGTTDEDIARPPSVCSSTKGHRRFAKRGLGALPSSNWRRLRNTLKAANEMQSNKKTKHALNREDSFLRKFSTRNHQNVQNNSQSTDEDVPRAPCSSEKFNSRFVIQHDGNFMFYWLGVVTVSVLYNVWTPIARQAFKEIQEGCNACWYSFDSLFDIIYICDIIVQFRTGYLDQGLMVYDSKKLRQRYTKSKVIYVDFISLLPLDLLQFAIGEHHPMLRFPRFLKVYRTFRFLHMLESRTAYPNLIRVANLTHILFLGAHWFAAFYYMISEAEGFTGDWSYPKPVGEFANVNRKYLRSLFWSTLTLTTIGDLPPPDSNNDMRMSNAAYVFVTVSYLIGVFVFATIVGQVGNVINNRNASRQEFERLLDGAKIYMQTHNVPHNLQKRVQRWYDYVWSRGRLNGCDINSLGLLPDKLKTELAIHVNLETLKKVTIFQECQPEFLHDLVLKMKAYIFTPGDLICRRGEVAREMFIIADGVVEIISESGVMLKRMGAGDFFGEIGILNLDGGINRRTADVRSVGYLELFVLSREDVLAALKDHPEAEVTKSESRFSKWLLRNLCRKSIMKSIIRDYGQRRLREVEAHRLKVKPLKCRGNSDQQGSFSGGSQTVPNRLLQTLRSLNPAVRRQSAQVNHHPGSPPAGGAQPGNPAGTPVGSQRCPNTPYEGHFSFDAAESDRSPTMNRLKQSNGKHVERQNSGNGRSHPMSIIQSPASDLSYQQITAQIQAMQGMIDKRLNNLEDVYHSACSKLEKLATSQETLLQLVQEILKQQSERNTNQLMPGDDNIDLELSV
ncbi:cyclic nucleotide-gated channel rod photoreceptor subunit alpha-like [Physella acuta]|uniref:cyclic nucleotide-gated channel rod photoreceptor subunit alpha-like n=1 Tax=Physella acuta TaxID=109671 RepID=UPI0027DAF2FF|nr:cyclic nucleotide-gated channel rod photoreceptor subunit alpha-like [Physella acuta]